MTRLAWFISFFAGFISLSEEILWVRIISFAFESTPQAFSLVLTSFLGGIALGALFGKMLSQNQKATPITAAWLLLLSGGLLICLPVIIIEANKLPLSIFWMLLLIVAGAALKGALFPVVHHLGSVYGEKLGRSVSKIYFCNILGSTLGPLFTGLFLLNHYSSGTSLQLLGWLCFFCATAPLLFLIKSGQAKKTYSAFIFCAMGAFFAILAMPHGEKLMHRLANVGDSKIGVLIENSHGIVHSVIGEHSDDTVYGGNIYDGRTNINLIANSNKIDRAYLLYGLHPMPKRVLVIGLSSGAWTRILTSIPSVEKIDVVEINPGYLKMIKSYPNLSPLLNDYRINIHIDDGRRWLRRSHEQFDLIVMNTTYHWRSNITSLLSIEMMEMIQNSLAPGGIFAFNTTDSNDAFYTATKAFPFAYRFRNFVYAARHDFRDQVPETKNRLRKFKLDDQLIFTDTVGNENALDKLASIKFTEIQQVVDLSPRPLVTITDQNMVTEFRFGRW